MNREKIEFPANIPTVVQLDGDGTLQPSKQGDDEYRYFLKGDRIMWVSPEVHAQILASGASKGDELTIERSKPGKAAATWIVRARDDERQHGYSNQPAPTAPRPQRDLRDEAYARDAASHRQPTSQAPPPARPDEYDRARELERQTKRGPQPAAQLAASAPELPITHADRMAAALRDAIDLIRGALQYEPSIAWTSADVRAIANTIFIETSKGARS